jgi:asparagine synthase (glutamine-hydrolysing)
VARDFFAIIWNPAEPVVEAVSAVKSALMRKCSHLSAAVCLDGLAFYAPHHSSASPLVHILSEGCGVVFGTIFKRARTITDDAPSIPADLSGTVSAKIVASGGRYLSDNYWGHYLAFVVDDAQPSKWVFRSPACHQPCLCASYRDVHLYFSAAEDCAQLNLLRFTINWDYIAAFTASTRVPTTETGLNQISELLPGQCQKISGRGISREFCWSPADISRQPCVEDAGEAKQALRATILSCVSSWASIHPSIVHRLSGGLDSSIVACCLRLAPTQPEVTCVNYHSPGAFGDEREYARAVTAATKFRHVEYPHSSSTPMDAILCFPRTESPLSYLNKIASDIREIDLARQLGASARFTGIMGDILFQMPPASAGVVEYIQRRGVDRHFLKTAFHAAQMDRISIWKILRETLTKGVISPQTNFRHGEFADRTQSLLPGDLIQAIFYDRPLRFVHPWLHDLSNVPFGKFIQIACLSFNSAYFNCLADDDESDLIHPFISEPLTELCLRIPAYSLMFDGWDRALARKAFERELPGVVRLRTTKGSSNSYLQHRIDCNREFIRNLLLDGVLAKRGIIDVEKLQGCLPGRATRSNVPLGLLWAAVGAEAWSRAWERLE